MNPTIITGSTDDINFGPIEMTWVTFDDGDTTPDVSGGSYFRTNNSSATTITDFETSTDVQIVVKAGDNNTTIQHSAGVVELQGEASLAMNEGDTITLVHDNGIWYEVARNIVF